MAIAFDRTLWMGDLAPYMDANFIGEAFHKMGEDVQSVKIVHDKYDGSRVGYCFVELPDAEAARRCMLSINGKIIPHSKPPTTFKLSFANNPSNPIAEHCLHVSNLPNEVDDAMLYSVFGRRYNSCRGARVFRNPDGSSKGIGLVRFGDETEQQQALVELNRWPMFGRPMNLKLAAPRTKQRFATSMSATYDPMMYYQQYQQFYNSAAWQMYDLNAPADKNRAIVAEKEKAAAYRRALGGRWAETPSSSKFSINDHSTIPTDPAIFSPPTQSRILDENQLPEEFDLKLGNVDKENELYMAQSEELYDSLEESNWFLINNARFHEKDLPESVE